MAVRTSLKLLAGTIGNAVRMFAAGEGWDQDDIAIAGTFDEHTGRIYVTIGTDRRVDIYRWHAGIKEAIRREVFWSPQITSMVNLVVKNVEKLDEVYYGLILGDDEIDITEMF